MSWTEKEPQCHRWKSWTSPIQPHQLAQSLEFCRLLLSCSDVPGTMSRSRYQNDNSKSLSQMWVFALKGIKSFFMFGADTVARLIHSHWARDGHSCSSLSSLYARGTLFMSLCDTVWRRAAAAELRCPFIIITHCHGGVCLLEAVLPAEFNPHWSPTNVIKETSGVTHLSVPRYAAGVWRARQRAVLPHHHRSLCWSGELLYLWC